MSRDDAYLDEKVMKKPFSLKRTSTDDIYTTNSTGVTTGLWPYISSCERCKKLTKFRCGQCKKVFYCCRECQRSSWKVHRRVCDNKSDVASQVKNNINQHQNTNWTDMITTPTHVTGTQDRSMDELDIEPPSPKINVSADDEGYSSTDAVADMNEDHHPPHSVHFESDLACKPCGSTMNTQNVSSASMNTLSPQYDEHIAMLTSMLSVSEQDARNALSWFGNNVESAADWLLQQNNTVTSASSRQPSSSPASALPNSSSSSSSSAFTNNRYRHVPHPPKSISFKDDYDCSVDISDNLDNNTKLNHATSSFTSSSSSSSSSAAAAAAAAVAVGSMSYGPTTPSSHSMHRWKDSMAFSQSNSTQTSIGSMPNIHITLPKKLNSSPKNMSSSNTFQPIKSSPLLSTEYGGDASNLSSKEVLSPIAHWDIKKNYEEGIKPSSVIGKVNLATDIRRSQYLQSSISIRKSVIQECQSPVLDEAMSDSKLPLFSDVTTGENFTDDVKVEDQQRQQQSIRLAHNSPDHSTDLDFPPLPLSTSSSSSSSTTAYSTSHSAYGPTHPVLSSSSSSSHNDNSQEVDQSQAYFLIEAFGVDMQTAEKALSYCNGDVNRAGEWLMSSMYDSAPSYEDKSYGHYPYGSTTYDVD